MKFYHKPVIAIFIASLIPSAPAIAARDASFIAKVSRTKQKINESADAAFVKSMSEKGTEIMRAGIFPAQVRDASKWGYLGFSLGVCPATNSQIANWLAAFDKLSISKSFAGSDVVKTFYDIGIRALSEGRTDDTLSSLTSAEKDEFCRVEMAAVSEVISELG
ncbi:hypothetical protein [Sphingorhabdus sp.]|jgi:hypothetical protein|uniref:hypothetical protein n=1 Tax=Sphingorhabdus sp. TaxID=1902408 RepID=UPI003784A7C8